MNAPLPYTSLAVALAIAFSTCSSLVLADNNTIGHITGLVRDALERPLPGATLQVLNADGKVLTTVVCDSQGHFDVAGLGDGAYTLSATATNFNEGHTQVTVANGSGANSEITLASKTALQTAALTAKRLDKARNGLSPSTGTSQYHLDKKAIENQAQGDDTPINHVLLTVPGVAEDQFGQIHVRGDHANVQYRIDGILLPEGISGGFSQDVDTRFADHINFLTGALPAQYGYRTAGVVDIDTKSGAFANGGRVSVYGGSNNWLEPSLELTGHKDNFNFYVTGSYLQNSLGIDSPTPGRTVLHDQTRQDKGFAYLSYLLNANTRVAAILGTSVGNFQIPDTPGLASNYTLTGVSNSSGSTTAYPSANLNENQREANHYGILALQGSGDAVDYQLAFFQRYSSTHYTPDSTGDLLYNGVASQVGRTDNARGIQGDASYRLNDNHTLRSGIFYSQEYTTSDNTSSVFPADSQGNQTSSTPETVVDNNSKAAHLASIYLQDEWKASDALTLNYGLRGDQVNAYVQESQISPRFNAVYKFSTATTVHAGYSRYFTPPPFELVAQRDLALFQNTTNAPQVNEASNVRSERDNYYDLGINHALSPKLQLGMDGYYKQAQHLLDEGQFGQALVYTPFNYAHGKVYGLELTANYRDQALSTYLNFAYSNATGTQIESSQFSFGQDELNYIATHTVHLDHDQRYSVSAGVAYDVVQTTYTADAVFGSGLRTGFANTQTMAPHTQVDLGAVHHFDNASIGKWDGRLSVINLFDSSYALRDGTGIGVGAPSWGPRRAFYVGLSKPFSW